MDVEILHEEIQTGKDKDAETGDATTSEKTPESDYDKRNVRAKLVHPSSPGNTQIDVERSPTSSETPGPKKSRVVVKDVAYTTYRAVLHYVRIHLTL